MMKGIKLTSTWRDKKITRVFEELMVNLELCKILQNLV